MIIFFVSINAFTLSDNTKFYTLPFASTLLFVELKGARITDFVSQFLAIVFCVVSSICSVNMSRDGKPSSRLDSIKLHPSSN